MTGAEPYSLAAILSTGEPERLYTGLSMLVSTAVAGERCAALATFRGLELMLEPDLAVRAHAAVADEAFAHSLAELRDTAFDMGELELYACAASVQALDLRDDRLAVMSTPRFLQTTAGARLVVV